MKIPGKTDMGDIMASDSTNVGDTWSEPVFIFNHLERQGTLQFAYANAILYKAPEQAVMWAFAMRCPMNYRHSEDSLHEGNIGEGEAPGELQIVIRTADDADERKMTDPPRAFSSMSNDDGRTWSPAQQEPELWNAKSKAFYGRATNGTHLYVYNDGPASPAPTARMALRDKLQPTAEGPWGTEKPSMTPASTTPTPR